MNEAVMKSRPHPKPAPGGADGTNKPPVLRVSGHARIRPAKTFAGKVSNNDGN
nr:hypothetical protein [Neorhizobium tomejilense]